MSAVTHARYQATLDQRFRTVLLGWLAGLPASGWSGTVRDLEVELLRVNAAKRVHAFIARGSGLSGKLRCHEGTLKDLGFSMTFRRTRFERTIHVMPIET